MNQIDNERLALKLSASDGELDLAALGSGAHHADHRVVRGAHYRLNNKFMFANFHISILRIFEEQ